MTGTIRAEGREVVWRMSPADARDLGEWMELEAEYPHERNKLDPNDLARWLLVDADRDGGVWFSTHDTPSMAADFHDTQAAPWDWEVRMLVDLDTGQRYAGRTEVRYSTTWVDSTTWAGLS